jgi:hypothetical protein
MSLAFPPALILASLLFLVLSNVAGVPAATSVPAGVGVSAVVSVSAVADVPAVAVALPYLKLKHMRPKDFWTTTIRLINC